MDFNDIVRGFFGFRQPRRDNSWDDDCAKCPECHTPGKHREDRMNPPVFFHDEHFFDMMQSLNPFRVFEQMEDAFNNFFSFDSSKAFDFDVPPEEPLKDGESYRDFLLNPSEKHLEKSFGDEGWHIGISGSLREFPLPRNNGDQFFNSDYRDSENSVPKHQDSDIDDSFHIGEHGLGPMKECPQHRSPGFNWSFRKSVSIRTVKGADGTVEEHRTEKDSSGNEVTTVRKSINDQSYSVTLHKDREGVKEKKEDLINLDEKDLEKFEEKWHNIKDASHSPENGLLRQHSSLNEDPPGDPRYSSIFKKLFRSS